MRKVPEVPEDSILAHRGFASLLKTSVSSEIMLSSAATRGITLDQ